MCVYMREHGVRNRVKGTGIRAELCLFRSCEEAWLWLCLG